MKNKIDRTSKAVTKADQRFNRFFTITPELYFREQKFAHFWVSWIKIHWFNGKNFEISVDHMVNHVNLPFFAVFPVKRSLITFKALNMNSTGPKTLVLVLVLTSYQCVGQSKITNCQITRGISKWRAAFWSLKKLEIRARHLSSVWLRIQVFSSYSFLRIN